MKTEELKTLRAIVERVRYMLRATATAGFYQPVCDLERQAGRTALEALARAGKHAWDELLCDGALLPLFQPTKDDLDGIDAILDEANQEWHWAYLALYLAGKDAEGALGYEDEDAKRWSITRLRRRGKNALGGSTDTQNRGEDVRRSETKSFVTRAGVEEKG